MLFSAAVFTGMSQIRSEERSGLVPIERERNDGAFRNEDLVLSADHLHGVLRARASVCDSHLLSYFRPDEVRPP